MPAGASLSTREAGPHLQLLYESPGAAPSRLSPDLVEAYGGGLAFRPPLVYGNLVSTVDGITALDEATPPAIVAAKSRADRFVMGLLRAMADAIVIGASTLRAEPRHLWLPENVHRDGAAQFAALRSRLGLPARPRLVVVTASGRLDTTLPALAGGALVLTTTAGAGALGDAPPDLTVRALGGGALLGGAAIVAAVREEGHGSVLTEGGPHLIGSLVEDNVLDELFLTLSPVLAGDHVVPGRRGVVEGVRFGAEGLRRLELVSARRHGSHLFLRYTLEPARSS